jgi:hypothetical protein
MSTAPWVHVEREPSLYIRCQCCVERSAVNAWGNTVTYRPQILASVAHGHVLIRAPRNDRREHYVLLDASVIDRLGIDSKIYCDCCDLPEKKILAERLDGLLLIRARRHGRWHFVGLTGERLRQLLGVDKETS